MMLADTDVLIDYLAGVEPARSRLAAFAEAGRLQTSVITSFELLSGARQGSAGDRVRQLVKTLVVIPLEAKAAEKAAEVRRTLEEEGRTIGMADSLIAGIALTLDVPLYTRNRKHFERVARLSLLG